MPFCLTSNQNGMIDKRLALIDRCVDTADVMAAVQRHQALIALIYLSAERFTADLASEATTESHHPP